MIPPILSGSEAYAWAWLRHGPLLPYVRACTFQVLVADLYPRGTPGWAEGRLTLRAGAYWAQHADPEEVAQAEARAIDNAIDLMPNLCDSCDGRPLKDPANPCPECMGTGLVHVLQPQPINRPLP